MRYIQERMAIRVNNIVKRVLMTADTLGGVWTYAVELVEALQRAGVEVALASMGRVLDCDQRRQVRRLRNVELFEGRYKLEWMNDPFDEVDQAGEWLQSIAQCVGPDVIHLNGYSHAALKWDAPVMITGHSCVYSWFGAVSKGLPDENQWAEYKRRVSAGLGAADYIVAPTRAMLDSLSRIYGVSFRGTVIHNGRGSGSFTPRIKDPIVLTAGRLWDQGKNIGALESVASGIPWQIYAAGDGLEHAHGSGIHWLGRCSSPVLAAWMGRASVYALPAKYEPFGLSVLEAALCGCALVLGDIPSLRELWEDCALFVEPDDHEQLQSTIVGLIDRPWRRRDYGERARKRALLYTPEKMADAYMHLYGELMGQHRGLNGPKERTLCA